MRLLLDRGADVDHASSAGEGWSALMDAAADGMDACVKLMLMRGADRSLRNAKGQTAMMLAEEGARAAHSDFGDGGQAERERCDACAELLRQYSQCM